MADVVASSPANAAEASTPKKTTKKAAKSVRPKASHPPTAVMVTNAIKHLKERGGSSLQAIKKYIASTYKVDAEKLAPFIKKYIKASVVGGGLVQTKGKGASGSFKLSSGPTTKAPATGAVKVAKKPVAKKPVKPKPKIAEKPAVAKKPAAKKVAKPKKSPVAEKKKAPVKAKPKSPAKVKKVAKAPTKKPKSPKPKTAKPKAAAKSPKKAASKKK